MDEGKLQADDVESGRVPPPSYGRRLSSVLQGSRIRFAPSSTLVVEKGAEEEAEDMTDAEIVAKLVPHPSSFPAPPKAIRDVTMAPYGPDGPFDLQSVLRGAGASAFNMGYVPPSGQSMTKVCVWAGV
jgi:hypothetical protein